MTDYSQKIAKAKASGYSDAEIATYLSSDSTFAPKIKQAKDAGYSDAEIIGHLSGASSQQPQAPTATGGAGTVIQQPLADIPGSKVQDAQGNIVTAGLKQAYEDFTDPISKAWQNVKNVHAREQDQYDTIASRSLVENIKRAPQDMATGLKNTLDMGAGVAGLALSPVAGAVNVVTAPTSRAVGGALYDAGLPAYDVGIGKSGEKLDRQGSIGALNNTLQTATSLAIPEKFGPPKMGVLSKAPSTLKVNPDVAILRARGVDVLPGAARGGVAKHLEDTASKLPILGTSIQNAREASIGSFNKSVLNDALGEIGQKLPKDIEAGHQANAHAYDAIQKAYDNIRPAQPIKLSPTFADVTQHPDYGILSPQSQAMLDRVITDRVLTKAPNGQMDGDNFTRAVSILRKDIKRNAGGDPEEKLVSEILKDKLSELQNDAMTQSPAYATQKEVVDRAYSKIKTAQDASQALGADNGVFSPSQYLNSVKKGDSTAGKNRFATGRAFNQDFAQAAKNVLSDKVANTGGTAGILGHVVTNVPTAIGAMIGGPAGAAAGFTTAGGALAGASRMYTPKAIGALNAGLDGRIAGPVAKLPKAGFNLRPIAPALSASGAPMPALQFPAYATKAAADQPQPEGQIEPGNIDIHSRPKVKNPDGSYSTVRSISVEMDGKTYLLPTVIGNRVVSNKEAIDHFKKTGEHLGAFKDGYSADKYAETLHEEQAKEYENK